MGVERQRQQKTKTADPTTQEASVTHDRRRSPDSFQETVSGQTIDRPQHQTLAKPIRTKPAFRGLSHELMAPPASMPVIQPKLTIGAVGDRYEQEADRVASQVVQQLQMPNEGRSQAEPSVQRESIGVGVEDQAVQRKASQPSSLTGSEASPNLESVINRARGSGHPLDVSLQKNMGRAMDADFSGVRVHTDAQSDLLNRSIQAKAFTTGQDMFFRRGMYQPGSRSGQELIAHELTHVVQQNGNQIRRKESRNQDNQNSGNSISISSIGSDQVQRRFGFEIEVPILFLHQQDFANVPAQGLGGVGPMPTANRNNVPCDASIRAGDTNVYDAHPDGADCHVNVDHNGSLDPLYRRELEEYGATNGLTAAEIQGLLLYTGQLMPHQASILEVVTDAWDENALTRTQARQKFRDVRDWVRGLFNQIQGNQQVALGNYFIGSTSPDADRFQPRLGYFHSTYGVKLSQVPRLFARTTNQKNTLRNYARTHTSEQEHADNVSRTFNSIARAETALTAIKRAWPRQGAGWFTGGHLKTKGSKGWNPGTEEALLGFLTLVDNYLLMFQSNSTSNLGKQKVGMHYYKSDLYDLAQQLPVEILNPLTNNAGLRTQVIAAIGASVGLAANAALTGPMAGWTLTQYLDQIFTGVHGVRGQDTNNDDIYDPLLAGSINPWSAKLGPEQIGPGGSQELGVVMENRHLEYMDPNYGANATASATQMAQDFAQNAPGVPGRDAATFESIKAREAGPARRPIGEWVPMMLSIYDMLVDINQ